MSRYHDPHDLGGQVQRLLQTIRNIKDDMTPSQAVDTGRHLWLLLKEAKDAAEVVRKVLRTQVGTLPGRHEIKGPKGSLAAVVVSQARPVLRKDADIDQLRQILGSKFDLMFTVRQTVNVSSQFEAELLTLPEVDRDLVLAFVDTKVDKGRVSFPRPSLPSSPREDAWG